MRSNDVAEMNVRLQQHATDAIARAAQMRIDADAMRDATRKQADALEAWARATMLLAGEDWAERPSTPAELPQAIDLPAFLGKIEQDIGGEPERAAA